MLGVIYVMDSADVKIGGKEKVDATYCSINSCPPDCPLKGSGCYAESGNTGIHVIRLNKEAENISASEIARTEANLIDASYNFGKVPSGRGLRLHVSGDCRTISGAKLVNRAAGRWLKRGGAIVWSYTHAWNHVHRSEWKNVSMLASVELNQVNVARENGYAPAIVVAEHKSNKTYMIEGSDVKWIPCVKQIADKSCMDCKLCFNADRLYKDNYGIAFSAHGVKKNVIKRRLNLIK